MSVSLDESCLSCPHPSSRFDRKLRNQSQWYNKYVANFCKWMKHLFSVTKPTPCMVPYPERRRGNPLFSIILLRNIKPWKKNSFYWVSLKSKAFLTVCGYLRAILDWMPCQETVKRVSQAHLCGYPCRPNNIAYFRRFPLSLLQKCSQNIYA